jgi:hypothetical protein
LGRGEAIFPCRKEVNMDKIDKVKYLKRVIIICWVALAICFCIKLFGGNLFEIMCKNENFIAICNYADTHLWAYYLIGALQCFISLYFFTLAILQRTKYKKWELILLIITVLVGSAVKMLSSTFGFIFDIWQLILFPALLFGKNFKKYLRVLAANVLLMAFQLISIYVKNINELILGDSILIGTIFSIDIWIMLLLYFAYSNIKSNKGGN